MTIKEKIREILWNFVAGEVTDSEAVQQILDLFAVSGSLAPFGESIKLHNVSNSIEEFG